jgi:hypothetical protein
MPTLITQDEFESELLLNPNLTMTTPVFTTLPVAQIPKQSGSNRPCGIGGWLYFPLKLKPSKFRATIMDLHKSTPTYTKSIPRPMKTRKRPRPQTQEEDWKAKAFCLSQWVR